MQIVTLIELCRLLIRHFLQPQIKLTDKQWLILIIIEYLWFVGKSKESDYISDANHSLLRFC